MFLYILHYQFSLQPTVFHAIPKMRRIKTSIFHDQDRQTSQQTKMEN